MVMRSLGLLIISALYLSPALAHEAADLAFILKSNPIETPQQREVIRFSSKETSELKLISTGLIRVYQKFVSTQDLSACNFTPSCSRFGMGVIQKYGFFRGILLTADRLLRDNGFMMHKHYHIDAHSGKYLDPVDNYSLEALVK